MDNERFTIRGATGVDLHLPVAGPGSRSYAFVIDWHVRLLLALAWYVAAMLLLNGGLIWRSGNGRPGTAASFLIILPPLIIYFLYHPIVEILMGGQTPGKRYAGVRLVNREGGTPGAGAILIRNVFRLVDSLPAFYVVGLITTFFSAQRLRIGDMAAGTLLVTDEKTTPDVFSAAAATGSDPTADLAAQILERWTELEVDKRMSLARSLLLRVEGQGAASRLGESNDGELRSALRAVMRRAAPE